MKHESLRTLVTGIPVQVDAEARALDQAAKESDELTELAKLIPEPERTAPRLRLKPQPPLAPGAAEAHLARVLNVVGTVTNTEQLLALKASIEITLSNQYFRAREGLGQIEQKHQAEYTTLFRRQNAEQQALKHKHEIEHRKLLEAHEDVEGAMKRELGRLQNALGMNGKAGG